MTFVIVELVATIKGDDSFSSQDWTAGWTEIPITDLDKDVPRKDYPIQGGTPINGQKIDAFDAKRTGLARVGQFFTGGKTNSKLRLSWQKHTNLPADVKDHIGFMPSVCFINRKMMHLVSGYRNYAAEKLLPLQIGGSSLRKPTGDLMMSCFNKMLDCVDILEVVASCYERDYKPKQNPKVDARVCM